MGDEYEKESRFQEAFKRGQKGQISDYKAWLQENQIQPDKANTEYITRYFQATPEAAPNHDQELEGIAEFIGFFSEREGTYHIPITGVTGIGKTQLLHTIQQLLDQLGTTIPSHFYNADRFKDENHWEELLHTQSEQNQSIILIDNSYTDKRIAYSLKKISEQAPNSFIITTWTPEQWRRIQEEISDTIPISKTVELTPLNQKTTVTALETATKEISSAQVKLSDEFYQQIHEASTGIPGIFHTLFMESLEETFHNQLNLGDTQAVNSAIEKLDLENAEARIYDLSNKKIDILRHILLSRNPQGCRPSELVDILGKDKSTVSYHLQNLVADRVLKKEKSGRSTFYSIREPLKPILQLRINGEGEIHA